MQVSEKSKRGSSVFTICVLLAVFCVPQGTCFADKGGWHLSTEPVTLTESGQRAIIGWGGETEILCLATDVSSSKKTTVIEFLPLPSEPNVTLGSRKTFEAAEKLLARRGVKLTPTTGGGGLGPSKGIEPFHITFHERLGAHDITVVKVNRPDEFADWVQEKAKALTAGQVSLPNSIRKLIAKYLNEYRCPYFVFDVIEVGPDPQSIEPIIYEFKSSEVFYPLEISSTFHGRTTIDLVVFSRCAIDQSPFDGRAFLLSNIVQVDAAEMQEVLPRLHQLLGKSAYIQAFKYAGRISLLRGNITAGPTIEHIGITMEQYARGRRWSFNSGIIAGTVGGVLIAFICLWPMYFAAKRQKPRWGLRLLAGFLLGMPLGFALATLVVYIKRGELIWAFRYWDSMIYVSTTDLHLRLSPIITFVTPSVGMGFIIFCFQLGLRRRWYLWCFIYAALAIPVAFLSRPNEIMRVFQFFSPAQWTSISSEVKLILAVHILVFMLLFFSGLSFFLLSSLWSKNYNSQSRWNLRLRAGLLLGIPLGVGLIVGVGYALGKLHGWVYLSSMPYPLIPVVCSMGTGFIIFYFRLGLRRWYLGWLLYVALAVFVAFISYPKAVEDVFSGYWASGWDRISPLLVAYLLVFVLLFLIARFAVWITGPRKSRRSSLSG